MKINLIPFSILLLSLCSSCSEDELTPEEDGLYGYFTYYGLEVSSNPSFHTKSDSAYSPQIYWAEITEVEEVQKLKIHFGNTINYSETTVDYTGIGNYSSNDTNLQCITKYTDGLTNPSYGILSYNKGTGGYMEILSHQDGIITGNLRYINAHYNSISGSYSYGGIDDCTFEIKLNP